MSPVGVETMGLTAARSGRVGLHASLSAQFVRYLACAGLAAAVNFGAGSVLVDGLRLNSPIEFPIAVAIAYALGMLVNFQLNRRYTFSSDRSRSAQARTFILVALSGLALTTAVAAASRWGLSLVIGNGLAIGWVSPLATPESLSRAIAIVVASAYSFAGHKYLTFHRGIRRPLMRLLQALPFGG